MREAGSFDAQLKALEEVMSAHRYEMTEFEADAWMRVIEKVPASRFLAFLSHHFAVSPYAPKVSDATKHLDLTVNPDIAFNRLVALVAAIGPYATPPLDDAILVATVHNLGGWVTVNEQLPDPREAFAVRAYRERFIACFNAAISQVRIEGRLPEGLKPIGMQSTQLLGSDVHRAMTPSQTINHQRPSSP